MARLVCHGVLDVEANAAGLIGAAAGRAVHRGEDEPRRAVGVGRVVQLGVAVLDLAGEEVRGGGGGGDGAVAMVPAVVGVAAAALLQAGVARRDHQRAAAGAEENQVAVVLAGEVPDHPVFWILREPLVGEGEVGADYAGPGLVALADGGEGGHPGNIGRALRVDLERVAAGSPPGAEATVVDGARVGEGRGRPGEKEENQHPPRRREGGEGGEKKIIIFFPAQHEQGQGQ